MLTGKELFMKEIGNCIDELRNLLNKLSYNNAYELDVIGMIENKIKFLEESKDKAEPYDGSWAITLRSFKDDANKIKKEIEAIISKT
jgi:hypothetical protein